MLIIYNASQSDEVKCCSGSTQLAHVILYTGDEAVRTRLRKKLIYSGPSDCDDPLVQLFLRDFPDQHLAENNLDLSLVAYKKEERLFEYCLHQLKVVLVGAPSHHGNNHSHTPLRGSMPTHYNMSSLSSHQLTTPSNSMMKVSPCRSVEEALLGVDESMTTGWSVQPKRIVLPPRPDRLGMLLTQ